MQESKLLSPKLKKTNNNISSPNLTKSKLYLPSRYGLDPTRSPTNMHTLLNSIQINTREEQNTHSQLNLKLPNIDRKAEMGKKSGSDFKPKPMKRQENDFQNYKQIFIDPKQQALQSIKEKGKSEQVVMAKQVCKDYQKLLQFQKGDSPTIKDKNQQLKDNQLGQHFDQCINLLSNQKVSHISSSSFYQQQIRVQAPDMPNSSTSSTKGSGYAPSIPLLPSKKASLSELLMRVKAGISAQDVEKEAHLAFYLGMVYQEKRNYHEAVRFYKRFLGFAKAMQDKIGLALGTNRVAVNLYYQGLIQKSLTFHMQNLKLSGNQNCFAAYYNMAICQRALLDYQKSLQFFQTALQWARQKGQVESQCITQGQLAVTYKKMQQKQQAIQHYQISADLCRKLTKTDLLQQNLSSLLLITSHNSLASAERLFQIASQAFDCAQALSQKASQQIMGCNMGIIIGGEHAKTRITQDMMSEQIEELDLNEEQTSIDKEKKGSQTLID